MCVVLLRGVHLTLSHFQGHGDRSEVKTVYTKGHLPGVKQKASQVASFSAKKGGSVTSYQKASRFSIGKRRKIHTGPKSLQVEVPVG